MDTGARQPDGSGAPAAGPRGAIFVLGATTAGQQGPVASWVSTAGWVAAAERTLGAAWVVTRDGLLSDDELRARASAPTLRSSPATSWRRRIPLTAKTAAKDVRAWRRGRAFSVPAEGPWGGAEAAFVWQRHDLFTTAGLDLADRLGRPSVLFAPATLVWEAARWGVRRPGWSGLLERWGEAPALRRADLVAAGSEQVAEQVRRLGVAAERILVVPTGVDLAAFADPSPSASAGPHDDLADRFVIGWVGSFRGFHALDRLIAAAAEVPRATLLLVGDGPERPAAEALARDLGVDARFTGTVAHADLPRHLAAMDASVVVAESDASFHYSPLKLAEYLAAGRAVVVPDVATITSRVTGEHDALVVPAGDTAALAGALRRLEADADLRARLGAEASRTATSFTWDAQLERVLAALDRLPPKDRP